MSLGWAILGTGRFAAQRIAPALGKAREGKAIAVVSRERERAEAFASEYSIRRAYDSLEAALSDPAINALWIATPNALHREAVELAARARKHVLCEKPLATTLGDARAMVVACRQAGVAFGTGFHLRHHPLHIETRSLVQQGRLGQVIAAQADWSLPPPSGGGPPASTWRRDTELSGGGIFTGTGVHALDLLRFVLDDEVETITALADSTPHQGAVENSALCLVRFRRGTLATVRCVRNAFAPANDLVLQGTTGTLRVRNGLDEQARGAMEIQGAEADFTGVPVGTDLYALQADGFAHAVSDGREPNASGIDGLRLVEATLALYESAASGRTITLEHSL